MSSVGFFLKTGDFLTNQANISFSRKFQQLLFAIDTSLLVVISLNQHNSPTLNARVLLTTQVLYSPLSAFFTFSSVLHHFWTLKQSTRTLRVFLDGAGPGG
jgi:hypothetical protein